MVEDMVEDIMVDIEEDSKLSQSSAEIVRITFTNGHTMVLDRDYFDVVFKENAIWVYDGKYTHNQLLMFPMHTISNVVCEYSMDACYEIETGGVRVHLPDDLDTTNLKNGYG